MAELKLTLLISYMAFLTLTGCRSEARKVVCYTTNWSQYKPPGGTYSISQNLDASLCTHVIIGFAQLDNNRVVAFEYNDDTPGGLWEQTVNLKRNNPRLQTLVAVGGWNHGPQRFSWMAATERNRTMFIESAIELLRRFDFEGIDLDWEYPLAGDRENLALLLQETREAFNREAQRSGRPRLLLSAALPAGDDKIRAGIDIPAANRYLDLMNVMTYDFHGTWESFTGHISPLYGSGSETYYMSYAMDMYLDGGADPQNLIVGIPYHGHVWTLDSTDTSVRAPASKNGTTGTYSREPGTLYYYEVCELLQQGYTSQFDRTAQAKYAFRGDQWVSYEDQETIEIKLQYIISNNFGGAMIWAVDYDDFEGRFCGQGINPLTNFIHRSMASQGGNPPRSSDGESSGSSSSVRGSSGTSSSDGGSYWSSSSERGSSWSSASSEGSSASSTSEGGSSWSSVNSGESSGSGSSNRGSSATSSSERGSSSSWSSSSIRGSSRPGIGGGASSRPSARFIFRGGRFQSRSNTQVENIRIFVCPRPYGMFRNPTDCHSYYICYNSLPMESTCGDDIFNPNANNCQDRRTSSYRCP